MIIMQQNAQLLSQTSRRQLLLASEAEIEEYKYFWTLLQLQFILQ